ncbi:MAG TPA: hypothetical protein VF076_05480, partial [Acidimicrobiales bacterium]
HRRDPPGLSATMARKGYSLYSPRAELKRRLYRRSRGNRAFAGLAGTWMLLRAIRRVTARRPEVVSLDKLHIGQSMSITLMERPRRRQKKAAREAGTSA